MKQFFGGLLLGIGILVMTVSGLCTLSVVVAGLYDEPGMVAREPSILVVPLLVGGLPLLLGFGLYRWGRSLLRPPQDSSGTRR